MALWLWATAALQHTIGRYGTTDGDENLGKSFFDAQRTAHGKDFELILTLKVEIRHPIGGNLAVTFRPL